MSVVSSLTEVARDPRRTPGVITGLAFGAAARLRRDRALHPHGVVFAGTFTPVPCPETAGTPLFTRAGARKAQIRFSRGAGLPEILPDVLGCAVRVVDAHGKGRHQDFLLASSLSAAGGRHVLLLAWDFGRAFYSSILLYQLGSHRLLFGGTLEDPLGHALDEVERSVLERSRRLRLVAATPLGDWQEVAFVEIDRKAPSSQGLRLNPWVTGGGIVPTGPLMGLRDPAYRASQAATDGGPAA